LRPALSTNTGAHLRELTEKQGGQKGGCERLRIAHKNVAGKFRESDKFPENDPRCRLHPRPRRLHGETTPLINTQHLQSAKPWRTVRLSGSGGGDRGELRAKNKSCVGFGGAASTCPQNYRHPGPTGSKLHKLATACTRTRKTTRAQQCLFFTRAKRGAARL